MNRVVVVTGASAGIGAGIALELARRGDWLVLAARSREALDAIAGRLETRGVTVEADVTRRADVDRIRDEAIHSFGRVDVWINNAGRGVLRSTLELTDEDVDEMMAINLKAALYGMQTIAPHFIDRGAGHIINISSFLGRVPFVPLRSAYSAAKAALNALTANVRVDLLRAHPGIHVSLVMPDLVLTGFPLHARGSTGEMPAPAPGSPATPQTVDEVATIVADVIDHPVAEVFTNPISRAMAARYFEDVDRFERQLR